MQDPDGSSWSSLGKHVFGELTEVEEVLCK